MDDRIVNCIETFAEPWMLKTFSEQEIITFVLGFVERIHNRDCERDFKIRPLE
jgi:hypothetical protein